MELTPAQRAELTEAQRRAVEFITRPQAKFSLKSPVNPNIRKIIIAVHGIGDQTHQETIQAVVTRFCAHRHYPGFVPLGAFYGGAPAYVLKGPPACPGLVGEIGFAEAYWADIPRNVADTGYVLQETKSWARTIVERVRVLSQIRGRDIVTRHVDYSRVGDVLEEMITTIQVLEALTFLAKKAGIVDFNLRKLLDDYVGDVQIVTEFEPYRDLIVARFASLMEAVHQHYPKAEIHIVAHSEGTVVSWLGLLGAMSVAGNTPSWLKQVRGFMTIGSPIDKHILMWPELFESFDGSNWTPIEEHRIKWRNYADYGDPVGFELDTARAWLERQGYKKNFEFEDKDDFAFTRYYLPGKAHIDYWQDEQVFGHFIDSVVKPLPDPPNHGPTNILAAQLTSYVAAYAIALAVVYGGVYVLYKALGSYLLLDANYASENMVLNIFVIGSFLAGVTVFWRMVRLTRSKKWWLIGFLIFATTAAPLALLQSDASLPWSNLFSPHATSLLAGGVLLPILGAMAMVMLPSPAPEGGEQDKPAPGKSRPATQPRTMGRVKLIMLVIGAGLLLMAGLDWIQHHAARGPLWPLLAAIIAFVYLWWLGTLIFDLVFVWHRYIRYAVGLEYLRDALWQETKPERKSKQEPA